MAKKLYVGSLPYSVTDDQLKEHFSQAGAVESAQVIIDRQSGRSKGFGFVEMATEEEAQKAIEMFNGQDLDGRTIVVNEARPMSDRPRGGSGGGRGFGGGGGGRGFGGGGGGRRRDF
ncbi:RNA recognition motif domain-containing protein [Patescibacteria group bacterium]